MARRRLDRSAAEGRRRLGRRPGSEPGQPSERQGAGRRRHHRSRAAGLVRAVPGAQRRPRQDVLPRHPAAAPGQAAVRARPLRLRPLRRRDRRRPRLHPDRGREGGLAAGLGLGLPGRGEVRRLRAPGQPGGGGHGPALGHPARAVRGLPRLDADGPHRHRLPDVRGPDDLRLGLGRGDRAADGAGAGAGRGRARSRSRTRSTSASPSSCRTSSGTSARTSAGAGSTCPARTWRCSG